MKHGLRSISLLALGAMMWALSPGTTGRIVDASITQAQAARFEKIKVRFNRSEKDRRLVDKDVDLVIDETAQKLVVRSADRPLDVAYRDVVRVLFEVTTHMRGGALGQIIGGIGGIAGTAIRSIKVNDFWCYIEYRASGNVTRVQMLEIDKENSERVIETMKKAFGDRVQVVEQVEQPSEIEKKNLADLQSKHDLKVDKKNHPLPEVKLDKALVVVVCPALAARNAGKGNQFKMHANDRVILVNKMGTYSFAYLDPGEYLLASQSENANGFRMELESGKEYYFLQNTLTGMLKSRTSLSRNSKEFVMHELSGAYYADWKRKK